jgi:hypothetical protein
VTSGQFTSALSIANPSVYRRLTLVRALLLPFIVVIASLSTGAHGGAFQGQRVGQPEVTFVDMIGPPPTLAEMYRSVDFVVLATVTSSSSPRRFSASSSRVVREHTLTVREAFKANEKVPVSPTFKVLQVGGTIEMDGRERTTAFPFPLLLKGEDAFLFLMREPGQDYFYVAFNGGAMPVDSVQRAVRVPALVRERVADFGDRRLGAVDDLVANLRRLRGR